MDAPSSTLPSLDTSPRRAGWFKRSVATLVMLSISVGSFAQVTGPILRGSYGQPVTGFAPNGTFIQNGVVVGNPHQQLHNLENPSLWTLGAAALTNTTDPSFVQGTLGQMEGVSAPLSEPGGLSMGRLYINTSPANPYTAAAPFSNPADQANQANNALIWNQAVTGTGGYQSAGGTWIARTHPDSSGAIFNSGLTGFVDKGVVNAAMDPNGGAVAVWLTQGAAVTRHLAAVQQQNANLLGSRIFFTQQNMGSLSPTQSGFNSQADATIFEQMIGSSPNLWGGGTDPSFQLGYIRDDGSAQFFNLSDKHFRGSQSQGGWSGDSGGLEFGRDDAWINAMLGKELRSAADKREKGLNAAAGIDMGYFQDSKALFMQGIDLYRHVNKGDWGLLDGLRTGAIGPGHPDYERARALSEDAFRQAYVYHTEYDTKLKYSKEAAAYQANQLQLTGVSNADLFGKGLNLFDKRGDPEQERLLGMLQRGELSESHPRYQEIRGLAEARFKVAYQKALEPPPKPNPLKQIVAVVIAAIVVYFTAGLASGWAGAALGASTTATGAVATTVVTATGVTTVSIAGVAATAIGSAVGAYAGAVVGAGIQTGSMSKALAAGENSLKGGVAGILVNTALAAAGVSGVDISSSLGVSERVGQAIYNTIAGSMSQSIAYGGSFGDALVNSAISNTTSAVSAMGANAIAGANLGAVGTEIAHGALGCAAGVARSGGSEGCGAGAVGAIVAHAGAQWLDPAMGRTLSDSEVAFFSGVAGGAAAALVGGSNNVQANFGIGQTTGQNAVENNYLTTRDLERALDALRSCTQGCDVLRNNLLRNEQQGGQQHQVEHDLKDLCKANPQACAGRVQDIGKALEALQKPETLALLGQQNVNALINRQVSDLGKAVEALQWGAAAEPTNRLIMQTAMAVGATALGGGVMLSVGRALMAACAGGPLAPGCVAATTELAIGATSEYTGVSTAGMTATGTTAMASRLANSASNATDVAQVVREARLVQIEAQAVRNPEFVDVLRPTDRLHILYGEAPGVGGHLWPGQPGKSVFPQTWTADKVIHEVGDIATNPNTRWYAQTGTGGSTTKAGDPARWVAWESRDGVTMRVVFEPASGRVVTAFPDTPPTSIGLKPIK
ncbi:MAG: EndoU domain-containing protein [Hydrogenophaga sp.]|nr:EndoU domain-containing protein [Hydrogenophaga sp.]